MNKETSEFYGAVLRTPWMNEAVKVSLKISRRDVLLLGQLIEKGLHTDDTKTIIPADAQDGLSGIAADLLSQADVPEEFSQSFRKLTSSGKQA